MEELDHVSESFSRHVAQNVFRMALLPALRVSPLSISNTFIRSCVHLLADGWNFPQNAALPLVSSHLMIPLLILTSQLSIRSPYLM